MMGAKHGGRVPRRRSWVELARGVVLTFAGLAAIAKWILAPRKRMSPRRTLGRGPGELPGRPG